MRLLLQASKHFPQEYHSFVDIQLDHLRAGRPTRELAGLQVVVAPLADDTDPCFEIPVAGSEKQEPAAARSPQGGLSGSGGCGPCLTVLSRDLVRPGSAPLCHRRCEHFAAGFFGSYGTMRAARWLSGLRFISMARLGVILP
jgi:hypothetical protein